MDENKPLVSMADFADLVERLSGKRLSDLLTNPGLNASCTNLCDCHASYCACHGSVTDLTRGDLIITPDDFVRMRDTHINDLKQRLEVLEKPIK